MATALTTILPFAATHGPIKLFSCPTLVTLPISFNLSMFGLFVPLQLTYGQVAAIPSANTGTGVAKDTFWKFYIDAEAKTYREEYSVCLAYLWHLSQPS